MKVTSGTILTLALSQLGQVQAAWGWGWCPEKPQPVGDSFEAELYAGNWYEIIRDETVWYEKDDICVTATYTYLPDRWVYKLNVNNRQWQPEKNKVKNGYIFGDGETIPTTVSRARCDDIGNCHVKFWWYPEGNY